MSQNKKLKLEYAEAVALLKELRKQHYNVIKKVAEETGVDYDSLRMYVYTYHRELIGLDPSKNKNQKTSRSATKYVAAVKRLVSEPKQPENLILHVADKLGAKLSRLAVLHL